MNNLHKEFIPYEQALALKELLFDEPCFGSYDPFGSKQLSCSGIYTYGNCIAAPTFSQAFRFFREKYDLKEQYGVFPHHTIMFNYVLEGGKEEEAELECLKKLIEIVKTK